MHPSSFSELEILKASALEAVNRCLSRYSILLEGPVILGLSGGKDSLSLLFLLADLGVDIRPAIVDLGYRGFKADEIAESIRKFGFRTKVLSVAVPNNLVQIPLKSRQSLASNLEFLASPGSTTPCGVCSQTKRMLLIEEAKAIGANWIALAHHRDDLITTLLKDYFAFEYYSAIGSYTYDAFRAFVEGAEIDLAKIEYLAEERLAATMGIRVPTQDGIEVVRPLALTAENTTRELVRALGISPFGSGCSHESFQSGQLPTKREIIHANLGHRLAKSPHLAEQLLEIALRTLDDQGQALFNPRAQRNERMPGFDHA